MSLSGLTVLIISQILSLCFGSTVGIRCVQSQHIPEHSEVVGGSTQERATWHSYYACGQQDRFAS